MKTKHNILTKIFLILLIAAGWGSTAWAERLTPTFVASYSPTSTSWYYIQFENKDASGFAYSQETGEHFKHSAKNAQNPAYLWQLVGNNTEGFKLVSMTGQYGYWNNGFLTGTDNASTAAQFTLVTGCKNNVLNDDYWAIQIYPSGQCLNPQGSNEIKSWNNDNGCRILFSEPSSADLAAAQEVILANAMNTVSLVFKDAGGNTLSGGTKYVKYTPASGTPVELSPSDSPFNFEGDLYRRSAFSPVKGYIIKAQTFDADAEPQTLTFTIAESVPEWYTMKPNNGGYISSDYATSEGRMHVKTGNAKPTNYAGIWTFKDVAGVGGQNLINAKYYDSRVLSVTGTDGSAVAMMDPVGAIRDDARYKFEIASNGFVQVQDESESLYLGNHSYNLVVRSNTTDGSLNLNLTRVPNLGKAVTIVVKDAENNVLPEGNIVYRSQREDIPAILKLLKNGEVYNFGNVPFLTSLFEDSAIFSIISCSYDEEHAELTFVVRKVDTEEWSIVINGDDNYEVTYNSIVSAHNGEQISLPVNLKAKSLTINAPTGKFIWGPAIDAKAKTVTFEIRDLATDPSAFNDGLFQLMLKNPADVATVNGLIAGAVGNGNIQSNYIYLMPAKGEAYSDRPFKFSGTDSPNQASSFIRVKKKSGKTYTLSYANGRSMDVTVSNFTDGVVTLNKAISSDANEPLDMPYFYGSGSTEFYVTPANVSDYYVYQLKFAGDKDDNTTLKTSLNVLNGLEKFKDGDIIVLRKGTMPAKSDFTPSNARVSSISTTAGKPYNVLTINMEAVKDLWAIRITTPAGSGINVENYKVVYNGNEYPNGATAEILMGTVPTALDLKTTCNDHFVWGPIIDAEDRTITFDLRPTISGLDDLKSGFYQLQLYDEYALTAGTPTDAMASVAKVNDRMADNTVNTKSNYIYLMPYSDYCTQTTNNMLKYNGVPKYADEPYSYIYITREGGKISIQQLDGRYPANDERSEAGVPSLNQTTISTDNIEFSDNLMRIKGWVIEGTWNADTKSTSPEGPLVAYNGGKFYESYFVTRPVITKYRVYHIVSGIDGHEVKYAVGPHNYLSNNLHNGSFIFIDYDKELPTDGAFTCQTTNDAITYKIGDAVDGIFPIEIDDISADVTNTVIHRQHGSYDFLESLDPSLRPSAEEGFIQVGQGMEEKTITTSEGTKTIMVQHASNFEIDLYCKPGGTIRCLIPATKDNTNAYAHMGAFQRWYDYDTELPLDAGIASFPNTYTRYNNGHVGIACDRNDYVNGMNSNNKYLPYLDVTVPTDFDVLNVACDCSDFADGRDLDNDNYLEPSLSYRVIYHIHNANLIAENLVTKTAAGKYLEEKEFIVPNVKYGRAEDGNKGDLIPLDLAWSNYWMYEANGTLSQLINENTTTDNGAFLQKVQIDIDQDSWDAGLRVKVLGGDADAHGKIGGQASSYSHSYANHFIYYYFDNANTRNEILADHEATITVKIKPSTASDAPVYNLAQFKLKFTANAEPLALPRVIGNPLSERSTDYFIKQGYQEIASLTFQRKELKFTSPLLCNKKDGSHNDGYADYCYGLPLEFANASYGYSYGNTWSQYKVTRMSWGFKYHPVALYEYNIKHPESTKRDMTDDYYLYVDAAEQPGQVASIPLEGNLCAGSRLYCYAWMASTNRSYTNSTDNANNTGAASVVLNLVGRKDGKATVLASYLPGTISNIVYDEHNNPYKSYTYGRTYSTDEPQYLNNILPNNNKNHIFGPWQQIGFSTILSEVGYDSYEVQVINNCYTTQGGDYALDDFRVFMKPPSAVVDFSTPVCSDEIEHIKIHTPFELLEDAATTIVDGKECYKVNYSFIDKAKYYGWFDEYCTIADSYGRNPGDTGYVLTYRPFTQTDYNNAFNAALMGSGTDQYVTDGSDNKIKSPSYWNVTVSKNFESLEVYDFANIELSSDEAVKEGKAYRETVAGEKRLVMKRSIRPAENWVPGREYIVVFSKGWVGESNFNNAATSVYALDHNCSFLSEFTIKPAIMVNSDVEYTAADALQACDGQSASMSICMIGIGPDGEKYKDRMTYDWWIGYGKGSSDPDVASTTTNSTVKPATVDNFLQLQWPEGSGSYLDKALDHFRACYTYATTLEGCPPCKAPEIYGDTYDFTQKDYDCIAHYLRPNDLGRAPLILGRNAFNTRLEMKDAIKELRAPGLDPNDEGNYDYNIYITIIPITPISAYDAKDNVIYCPAPQQVKVRLFGKAPSMIDGFGALTYPSDLQSIPVRAGLKQIKATTMDAAGNVSQYLRVPLRNVKTVNESTLDVIKYEDGGETLDYVYLSGCDDPNYTDEYIADVKDNILQFIPVGKVRVYSAKGQSKEAFMEIAFSEDFQPREGYTYTLKSRFAEQPVEGKVTPCPGSLYFDLKIVPEYEQWTANYETVYTNDVNWARSDYETLHAGNAASDGTTPLAGYTTNAKNYEKDARYVADQEKTAHGFTPMYFTNVLMREPNCLAPVMYPMEKAPAAYPYQTTTGNTTDDFLKGRLLDKATALIQYDMLVTPIDDTNKPLPLASRYAAHAGNYGCEPFWTNVCDGLTFQPGTSMYDAQYLTYNRAWVEYELDTKRWYTLASPLQSTYAGEWYSPEAGGRQLTPHFYPVTYNEALNDRFNPAYYQRSWDKAGDAWIYSMPGDDNAYLGFTSGTSPYSGNKRVTRPVLLNWGYVYNDVEVPYSQGGFSVNVRYTDQGKDATGSKALVRMPKDDDAYYYYESEAAAGSGNTNGQNPDGSDADAGVARPNGNGVYKGDYTTLTRTGHHRLMSDLLLNADGTEGNISQYLQNRSRTNPYYLVGNPFMAALDMNTFFAQNNAFSGGKYWIMTADNQSVSVKVGNTWISTDGDGGAVAPLQSFFVSLPTNDNGDAILPADSNGGVGLAFTSAMQMKLKQIGTDNDGQPVYGFQQGNADTQGAIYGQKPVLRSRVNTPAGIFRITAMTKGQNAESNAVVYFSGETSNVYNPAEDAEVLLDGNTADKVSTVFTAAATKDAEQPLQALSINSMSTSVSMIPVGVVAPKDDTRTTLTFSGISTLEAVMDGTPHLYDADNDTFTVLDEDTAITVTGTSAGRYFIVCGTKLPFVDEEAAADDETNAQLYNLNGVRIATPQHGTVNIRGSRKEYNK